MIATHSLSVHYGNSTVVRNISLQAPAGQVTAILGPSGCGKSSFLAAINRMTDLIPGAHVTGEVQLDGQNVKTREQDLTTLRRTVGMIFQKPNPFPLSIRRNLQLALREHGVTNRAELDGISQRVLQDVGLWEEVKDRLDTPALQLSGGQQQRLCIARALALEPRVLLMDEPCSALDPLATAKIESLITRLQGRYTILIVTHNLAQARRIANHVAVFWIQNGAGEMIEYGPSEQVFQAAKNPTAAAYLAGDVG